MRLKKELDKELGVSTRIRWGGIQELRVLVDGKTVFSNREAHRLPNPGEVAALFRADAGDG